MESTGFNVVSWNVNGLRTINIKDTLAQLNCFILGIQETKLASTLRIDFDRKLKQTSINFGIMPRVRL